MRILFLVMALLTMLAPGIAAQANVFNLGPGFANLDTVAVGDAGNTADYTTRGSVGYFYSIGKYEVTAKQYTDFLNNKAASDGDPNGLYNTAMADPSGAWGCNIQRSGGGTVADPYIYTVADDWANRPVNHVSFWDSCRFANWLGNGQGNGDTESGAYALNGYNGDDGHTIQRSSGGKWVVTSEDEWYKAAYYKGGGTNSGYWDSPTMSNTPPANQVLTPDPGNSANYYINGFCIGLPYLRTNVGEFENSPSAYGTFDQGGNVWEWNEAIVDGTLRGIRGGSFDFGSDYLLASNSGGDGLLPTDESLEVGFRVVSLNNLPVAVDDKAVTVVGSPVNVNVLSNDYDPDGDTLSVTEVTQGAQGAVSINPDETVRYVPAPGFSGTDTFTYTVSDGNGGSAVGTVEIFAQCIMLTSPNGGETFTVGTAQFVTWTYGCNIGPYVRVELLKGGMVRSVISDHALVGANGVGMTQWTVPTNLPGDDYWIRVSSVRNPAITDASDATFTVIAEPEFSMTLTSPNAAGTEWLRGVKQTITWTYTGTARSSVRIDLLRNGSFVRNLAQNYSIGAGGVGKYDWVPTSLASGSGYKIRITLTSRPTFSDESDSPFKLL